MKPLYIINPYSGDVRRERATTEEIEAFIDGRGNGQLAHVAISADGDIIATPLTDAEIKALTDEFRADRIVRLRALFDSALALCRNAEALDVMWSSPITIWPANQPWAETVMREWAAERGLTVEDESPPRDRETWIRTADVRSGYRTVIHAQWPSVKLGEHALAIEVMSAGIAEAF